VATSATHGRARRAHCERCAASGLSTRLVREPAVVEEFAHAVLVLPEGLGALPDVFANDSGGVVVEM
jgi:hypothetical protein